MLSEDPKSPSQPTSINRTTQSTDQGHHLSTDENRQETQNPTRRTTHNTNTITVFLFEMMKRSAQVVGRGRRAGDCNDSKRTETTLALYTKRMKRFIQRSPYARRLPILSRNTNPQTGTLPKERILPDGSQPQTHSRAAPLVHLGSFIRFIHSYRTQGADVW
jgi:hypothetical protein